MHHGSTNNAGKFLEIIGIRYSKQNVEICSSKVSSISLQQFWEIHVMHTGDYWKGLCEPLRVSTRFCDSCEFLQVSARFCEVLRVSASFCKFLRVSASFCEFLWVFTILASFCEVLRVTLSYFEFLWVFGNYCLVTILALESFEKNCPLWNCRVSTFQNDFASFTTTAE